MTAHQHALDLLIALAERRRNVARVLLAGDDGQPVTTLSTPEAPSVLDEPELGYPAGWPRCPGCGLPALDGHITCGDVVCNEAGRR